MTYFVELLINGVSIGLIYALIAIGFTVIFKATQVLNFAQGSTLLLGAYVVVQLQERLGFYGAVLAGVAVAAAVAGAIEVFLVRRASTHEHISLAILTLGIDIALATELSRRIGSEVLSFADPWGNRTTAIGPFVVPQARLAAMVVCAVIAVAFFALLKYTSWGIAVRATAEDPEAAALMGINRHRVAATSWALAGGLAAVAGVFMGTAPSPGLTSTANVTALNAFPAAVIGGLDSPGGAVVGGLIVGVVQSLSGGYNDQVSFLGSPLSEVSGYVVMIMILLWRPSGLYGTREMTRV
ncbi:branched-chain amino acid ABC transporter permease [Nocardioides endophyticus]|uniref:Branched-chain amino acid ABC transporter permease n=1 Tax=Nocardioides endophyticus TaxID=1353775 RepID=A0ABP8ZD83_9ACTN